jgi:hypothetical protein
MEAPNYDGNKRVRAETFWRNIVPCWVLRVVRAAVAAAILPTCTCLAQTEKFPSKAVTLVVPWPAGGTTDITMRALAAGPKGMDPALRPDDDCALALQQIGEQTRLIEDLGSKAE